MDNAGLKSLTTLLRRMSVASALGRQYDGQRDLYEALGWKKELTFDDYYRKYQRGIGRRIVTAYPDACWRGRPTVLFANESAQNVWEKLCMDKNVWHYLKRADILSGIGRYGVLVIGVADGKSMSEPLTTAASLEYLMPYAETSAQIATWDTDPKSIRYNKPLTYSLSLANGLTTQVHHTRVLHIAEDLMEDDVYGVPRLEAVYNYIESLETVAGGSAEMYFRGAFPGMALEGDADADFSDEDRESLNSQLDEYTHGLRRTILAQGARVNQLSPQTVSPVDHIRVQIELISGTTGIPQRILLGSERGELASTTDQENWFNRVDERRQLYCEVWMLNPFILKMQNAGILPKSEWTMEWPDLPSMDAKSKAGIAELKVRALYNYVRAPGADLVVPPEQFLIDVWGYTKEKIEKLKLDPEAILRKEAQEMELAMKEQEASLNGSGSPSKGKEAGAFNRPKDVGNGKESKQ